MTAPLVDEDTIEHEYRCPCGRGRIVASNLALYDLADSLTRTSCRHCLTPALAFVRFEGAAAPGKDLN